MSGNANFAIFLDVIGRTIIGEKVSEDDKIIQVKNPVVVHVVPQQDPGTGQMKMSLQLFPIFFREFLADKDQNVTWNYRKDSITFPTEPIIVDFKLEGQYRAVFASMTSAPQVQQAPAQPQAGGKVIKLFED